MAEELDTSEFLGVFLQEAEEQIENLDEGLLDLEKHPENTDTLNAIFRAAHTLKGSSATMGFGHIRDLTHDAETLLDALREATPSERAAAVDPLLRTSAVLRRLVVAVSSGEALGGSILEDIESARAVLASAGPGQAEASSAESRSAVPDMGGTHFEVRFRADCQMPAVRAFVVVQAFEASGNVLWTKPDLDSPGDLPVDTVLTVAVELADNTEATAVAARISAIPEIASCKQAGTETDDVPVASPAEAPESAAAVSADPIQTVRVSVERLDRLVNLVGELVVDRTGLALFEGMLSDRLGADGAVRSLRGITAHMGTIIGDLHDEIMRMRMLPVGQVFKRYVRMIRDLSHKLGKRAELVLEGEETGLDRSLLEDIVDPLTHMLRNCIDHGIEAPDQRLAAGKPEVGSVVLSARHEEGHIVIEIEDDGKGIDPACIRQAAVDRRVISAEAAAKLDDRESLALLFASGVSTADGVTDISGRGVGMDVVKANIERLHGQIEVTSTLGLGSRFTVRLPLTLAVLPALIVRSEGRLFALPLASVVSATTQEAERVHRVQGTPCVLVRGETLPLVSANAVFQSGAYESDGRAHCTVVTIQSRGRNAALAVDELLGTMDIVVKPLGEFLRNISGFSGAAILGDGHIALIIDAGTLLDIVRPEHRAVA